MLVEDSEPDVILVRHALSAQGLDFHLEVLADGEEAVEYTARLDADEHAACPDLILLDLNLPKLGGHHVLERVRRSLRCSQIPVVILTSSGSPWDQAEAARLGATHYFQKPSRLEEFMKIGIVVREILGIPSA